MNQPYRGDRGPKKTFLWGVSNSAYQHEGGYNTDDGPWNNWRNWEAEGRIEATGRSVDFWNRYEEDFSLAAGLGCNAFRLSVDWSRVQPGREVRPHAAPPIQETALDHYAEILTCCRRHGLEPLVTLFHFTHPFWLGSDPWLDLHMPGRFAAFTEAVVSGLNRRLEQRGIEPVRWWITINEPNMLAANTYNGPFFPAGARRGLHHGLKSVLTMLEAHTLAYRRIHNLFCARHDWGRPMVSLNTYASDLYWNDKFLFDLLSLPSRGISLDEAIPWLHSRAASFEKHFRKTHLQVKRSASYWLGALVKWLHDRMGRLYIREQQLARFLDLILAEPQSIPLDFLGFDYYEPFVFNTFRFPRWNEWKRPRLNLREWSIESLTARWWEWKAAPEGLRLFVKLYAEEFPGLPILIAENGMAEESVPRTKVGGLVRKLRRDHLTRAVYIRGMLKEVIALRAEGYPLIGYFHWSLTDNYEWGTFSPRFGIYSVDHQSPDLIREEHVDPSGDSAAQAYREMIQRAKDELGD